MQLLPRRRSSGALHATRGHRYDGPAVAEMLRALEESSLDLRSMNIPGGFSGIDSAEASKMRPEHEDVRPEPSKGNRLALRQAQCTLLRAR